MSFSSKYPDILKSIAPSLVNYYKQFAEKEKIASVNVNHGISSTPSIDKFCTYLINHDGVGNGIYGANDKESISSASSLRSFTIIPQEIPTPEEKEQVQEPTRETTPPKSVETATPVVESVADSTTTTSTPPTPPTPPRSSGATFGDVRRNSGSVFGGRSRGIYEEFKAPGVWRRISRSRYNLLRNQNSTTPNPTGSRRRRGGGIFGGGRSGSGGSQQQFDTPPNGRARYPFEVRDGWVWKRNKWERI